MKKTYLLLMLEAAGTSFLLFTLNFSASWNYTQADPNNDGYFDPLSVGLTLYVCLIFLNNRILGHFNPATTIGVLVVRCYDMRKNRKDVIVELMMAIEVIVC